MFKFSNDWIKFLPKFVTLNLFGVSSSADIVKYFFSYPDNLPRLAS